jgi:hypothetical protein
LIRSRAKRKISGIGFFFESDISGSEPKTRRESGKKEGREGICDVFVVKRGRDDDEARARCIRGEVLLESVESRVRTPGRGVQFLKREWWDEHLVFHSWIGMGRDAQSRTLWVP